MAYLSVYFLNPVPTSTLPVKLLHKASLAKASEMVGNGFGGRPPVEYFLVLLVDLPP